jgi:hypothetical protein
MMLARFPAAGRLQRRIAAVGALLLFASISGPFVAEAAGQTPDPFVKDVPVGRMSVIPLEDVQELIWPPETGDASGVVSDEEVLMLVKVQKLNGKPHLFVSGKRIGLTSVTCVFKRASDGQEVSAVYTFYVTQDVPRVQRILDSYNAPDSTQLTARLYGTGERIVIEGVVASHAQLTAILRQLPNKDLLSQYITLNMRYKCHCVVHPRGVCRTRDR